MQSEQDWLEGILGDDEEPELDLGDDQGTGIANETKREAYKYFMRPEPKTDMGPVERELDIFTRREMRYRMIAIGMTRNAKAENKPMRKVYLDPLPHIRIDAAKPLQGWYQSAHYEGGPNNHRPRPCFSEAILTEPYGGFCTVGCSFCYVNSGQRGYRGSGLVSVPMNYGPQVAAQLSKIRTGAAGYFSSFTDPFLPLEDFYHNTERAAGAFVDAGLPIFFLSRIKYPGWAIDLLRRNPYSYAQKSLNTGIDEDYKAMSPGAASLSDHIAEVGELRKAGIYTSIQVNPILPGITSHEDIRVLFERLAAVGNNHVIVKFVEAGYSWAPAMVERLGKRFGDNRAAHFAGLFVDNIGGQRTIAEEYRLEAHQKYRAWATELGMTYASCYEYKYARDEFGEISSKQGISIGKDVVTSAQCHGQRVPVFTRLELTEPFREVVECPDSGCLHCAEDNDGDPRCGSELMGQAHARSFKEMKVSVYDGGLLG